LYGLVTEYKEPVIEIPREIDDRLFLTFVGIRKIRSMVHTTIIDKFSLCRYGEDSLEIHGVNIRRIFPKQLHCVSESAIIVLCRFIIICTRTVHVSL